MKSLYLLRHATASAGIPGQRDNARPLDARGLGEARAIGERLASSGGAAAPSLVLCSDSRRTLETLREIEPHLAPGIGVCLEEGLYCADRRALQARIEEAGEASGILLIAHNPGIAVLASALAARGDPTLRESLGRRFPAASLAILDFDIEDWSAVAAEEGTLVDLIVPGRSGL